MSKTTPQSPMRDDAREPKQEDIKLKLAGAGYIIGDGLMIGAAMMRVKEADRLKTLNTKAISAAWWMAGGIGAAIFGNPSVERQVQIQAGKLEAHLKRQGITIPQDVRAKHALLKERSFWDSVADFCYEHPSELLNTGYAIGAALLLHKGFKEIRSGAKNLLPAKLDTSSITSVSSCIAAINKSIDNMSTNFGIGAMVLPGALIGLFAKEDPKAQEKAKDGNVVDKAVAFVAEKPLRISAGLYMLNNLFLAADFGQDWTRRARDYATHTPKPHWLSGAQLATYIACNILLLMSSRNQITDKGFDEASINKFAEAAASIIAAQPVEQRDVLIANISEFMSKQDGIKRSPEQLEAQLRERLQPKTTVSPAEHRHVERVHQRELAEHATHTI
ncbi:MAG: hypothetical protein ACOYJ2_05685 [Rickettsiales bacterium]